MNEQGGIERQASHTWATGRVRDGAEVGEDETREEIAVRETEGNRGEERQAAASEPTEQRNRVICIFHLELNCIYLTAIYEPQVRAGSREVDGRGDGGCEDGW